LILAIIWFIFIIAINNFCIIGFSIKYWFIS
jgi:hypothetical protein